MSPCPTGGGDFCIRLERMLRGKEKKKEQIGRGCSCEAMSILGKTEFIHLRLMAFARFSKEVSSAVLVLNQPLGEVTGFSLNFAQLDLQCIESFRSNPSNHRTELTAHCRVRLADGQTRYLQKPSSCDTCYEKWLSRPVECRLALRLPGETQRSGKQGRRQRARHPANWLESIILAHILGSWKGATRLCPRCWLFSCIRRMPETRPN